MTIPGYPRGFIPWLRKRLSLHRRARLGLKSDGVVKKGVNKQGKKIVWLALIYSLQCRRSERILNEHARATAQRIQSEYIAPTWFLSMPRMYDGSLSDL